MTQVLRVRIWGLNILIGEVKGRGHFWENRWLLRRGWGERSLVKKQRTFQKAKWALRRIDGRYDSLWQSDWVWCWLLIWQVEKIRVVPGGRDLWCFSSFGRLCFEADKAFQELGFLQLKIIFTQSGLFYNPLPLSLRRPLYVLGSLCRHEPVPDTAAGCL